ncbi:hypothetical protein SAMN02910327_00531 [Peptostreptococcaceae bacterium pGA-8]|nr:hypothetical protein SAMN02910327_00531 [Peptostreptococcaceae bacterium pGA-8]
MKILVLSDTHGKLKKAIDVHEKIKNVDLIIHCGDYQKDGELLEQLLDTPVVSVSGNCDEQRELEKIVSTPYGDILAVHGHLFGLDTDLAKMSYRASELNCIAVCFGHTHIPEYTLTGDIYMINPGSLSLPRDGSNGSYAVITSTEDDFYGAVVYYDTVFPNKKDSQAKADSRLRNLLNYSDRF